MSKGPAEDAGDSKSIDPSGFDALEQATGITSFKLDDDSRHRLEWALFWARTAQANKAQVDIANLTIELAVQYARAAQKSVLAPDVASDKPASKSKEPAVTPSFFGFVRSALDFVPEAGKLSDTELRQHIRRALATARRQKDDAKSRMPDERREELHIALGR
jgi:uncharacterized membrane protein